MGEYSHFQLTHYGKAQKWVPRIHIMKIQLECLGRGGVDMIEGHSFHLAEMF